MLGIADDEAMDAFRVDPGKLSDRRWQSIPWQAPATEMSSCWWIANAGEPDKSAQVQLISKSLQFLKMELQRPKSATSIKVRQAYTHRLEDNRHAMVFE